MKKRSLAEAKAHLSELVDEAEHHGRRVIILRHGKPAAAIVPVAVAVPPAAVPRMTEAQAKRSIAHFVDELSALDPESSAVEDLLRGRR